MRARWELRQRAERELRDKVLSTIYADDVWLWSGFGSGMTGLITREGLHKLRRHPDVLRIELPRMVRLHRQSGAENITLRNAAPNTLLRTG